MTKNKNEKYPLALRLCNIQNATTKATITL